jgi:hypothetical protein
MLGILLSAQLLTCSEYDFLVEGIRRTPLTRSERITYELVFIESTDPQCFETQDAND